LRYFSVKISDMTTHKVGISWSMGANPDATNDLYRQQREM